MTADSEPSDGLNVPADVLAIDDQTMRRLGYLMVDRTIEHIQTLGSRPAISESEPADLMGILGGPPPRTPHDLTEGLALLADVAGENQQHGDHPRYFARVAGPAVFPSILGDWIGAGLQSVASSWGGGSGPTAIELISCRWISDAIGFSADTDAIMQSGGSLANITGIVTGRHVNGDGVIYLSDQTHSSLSRSLPLIGQPVESIHSLPSNATFRLDPDELRAAVLADISAGRRPTMAIATAGSTNTGAVDDIEAIADICDEFGMWLHIDGAYGGPVALTQRGAERLPGITRADSFVLDPHKWLFQVYDMACLFVQRPGALDQTFAMYPEYLADAAGRAVDLHNRSFELTRRARAFKLWLTIRTYGLDTIGLAIERGIALAEFAQSVIESIDPLEIVTPAQLGIVTFADSRVSNAGHVAAAAALTADGYAAVTSTVLAGRTVLRLCIINPATTVDDVRGTIERLAQLLAERAS